MTGRTRMLAIVAPLAAAIAWAPELFAERVIRQSAEAHAAQAEASVVHRGGAAPARPGREQRRRSIAYLAHITDPQITDEVSPARVGFGLFGTRRAHDPFTMRVLDPASAASTSGSRARWPGRAARAPRSTLRWSRAT